jgi:8-oxo-dGTP pyrophosphatase MutT (NUDIX family)
MSIGRFLVGIAALIWNPENGKYLLLRRAASRDFGAGTWECVTGHVDQGESFTQAFIREVGEEVGGEARLEFFIGTEHFYRGEPSPKNELLSLICACTLVNPEAIQMSAEHDDYCWLTAVEITEFLPANHWLLPAISRAEWLRTHLPETARASFWARGLEISEQ